MRRLIVVVVAAVALSNGLAGAPYVAAESGGGGGGDQDPWVWVGQSSGGYPGGPAGGGGSLSCAIYVPGPGHSFTYVEPPITDPVDGERYVLVCVDAAGDTQVLRIVTWGPGGTAPSAADLAAEAYSELPLVYPDPHTAPPYDEPHLVGVPSWLWVDPAQWGARSATASLLGLSATVTAVPERTEWDMGDGAVVVCNGPGTPWSPGAESACTHAYGYDGKYVVSVQIWWSVTWSATDGNGGALPEAWRGTRFPLDVIQVQAVVS